MPFVSNPPTIVEAVAVMTAAQALLERLEHITTDEFASGGERVQREALWLALVAAGQLDGACVHMDTARARQAARDGTAPCLFCR